MYAPDSPFTVYELDYWWSDQWEPLDYGQEYDFTKPFFAQFGELMKKVPRPALTNINPTNSEYCNMCEGNKNCYLVFGGDFNEDSMYGNFCMRNRTVLDCDTANDNEACYFIANSFDCYGSQFCFDSKNCSNCAFVSDCIGCSDCILCTNLTNQTNCIRNKKLAKEAFEKQKMQLLSGTFSQQQKNWNEFEKLLTKRKVKHAHIINCQDSTGDYLKGCKNCLNCFDVWDCEDCLDVISMSKAKDVVNSSFIGDESEICYNVQSSIAYDCTHSFSVWESKYIDYCENVFHSEYMFGCSNIKKNKYCILNKKYGKEEYSSLRKKIIQHMQSNGEWGQYLPPKLSYFGYNESTASDLFPLSKNEALLQGFRWRDEKSTQIIAAKVIPADKLPDSIKDIPDDVLNWAIVCETTQKPFLIQKQELDFYRQYNISIPHLHPDERYRQRLALKNPFKLWQRTCASCNKFIQTTYAPDRPETVYCEECYLKEIY